MPRADPASQRVRLAAHARPLRRGVGQVQFGLDPRYGVVLAGLSEAEVGWLLTLGGRAASRAGVPLGSASSWGVTADRSLELLAMLRAHRLLAPAATPEGPRAPGEDAHTAAAAPGEQSVQQGRVCVLGRGAVAAVIAGHLAGTAGHAARVTGLTDDPSDADVVVLVVGEAVGAQEAAEWAGSRVVHLPVVVTAHRVVVGPMVTSMGPCLCCLDHHRRDRDEAWPLLLAQVDDRADAERSVDVDPALSAVAAGVCTMLVLAYLRTGSVPVGIAWEARLPWPSLTARRWVRHPACGQHSADQVRAVTG